jgi:ubiquinone/menaquinone biosynthesis C-methylase UbiE
MQGFSTKINPEEFKEWNERMVQKYDPDAFHHHSNPLIRLIERRRVRAIVRFLDINEETRVLEIGCGAGNVIEETPFGKLFGVDISSSILKKAKQKLNWRVHLFQGDAQNLPCKDEVFRQVICSEVLEHLLSPSNALHEMARILRPHGVAVISVPNEVWINRIKNILVELRIFRWFVNRRGEYKEMPERMEDEWHLHALRLKQWLSLFKQCFEVTRLRRIPFSWLPLRYVIRLEKLK